MAGSITGIRMRRIGPRSGRVKAAGGQRAAGVVIRACLYVDDPLGAIGGRMRRREGRGQVRTNSTASRGIGGLAQIPQSRVDGVSRAFISLVLAPMRAGIPSRIEWHRRQNRHGSPPNRSGDRPDHRHDHIGESEHGENDGSVEPNHDVGGGRRSATKTVMVLPRTDRGIDRTIGMTTSARASMERTMVRSSRTMTWVADDAPPPRSWSSPDLIGGSTGPSA